MGANRTRTDSAARLLARWRDTFPELSPIQDVRAARYRSNGRWFMPLGGNWLEETKFPCVLFDSQGFLFIGTRAEYQTLLDIGHLKEHHGSPHDTLGAPMGITAVPGYRAFPRLRSATG